MTKLYYVPTILVVESDDEGSADARVEEILDNLVQLNVYGLEGYTLTPTIETSEAPANWAEYDHEIECNFKNGVARAKVIEVPL